MKPAVSGTLIDPRLTAPWDETELWRSGTADGESRYRNARDAAAVRRRLQLLPLHHPIVDPTERQEPTLQPPGVRGRPHVHPGTCSSKAVCAGVSSPRLPLYR
jgi:hypothetical protein